MCISQYKNVKIAIVDWIEAHCVDTNLSVMYRYHFSLASVFQWMLLKLQFCAALQLTCAYCILLVVLFCLVVSHVGH